MLDGSAEARWVKRFFIADNSALANALGGPNPTLTTQALATRTAEKIFQRYFDGAPWIGQESPVSSIDPAVTQAVIARGLTNNSGDWQLSLYRQRTQVETARLIADRRDCQTQRISLTAYLYSRLRQ